MIFQNETRFVLFNTIAFRNYPKGGMAMKEIHKIGEGG